METKSHTGEAMGTGLELHRQPTDLVVDHEYSLFDENNRVVVLLNSMPGHEDKIPLLVYRFNAYPDLLKRVSELEAALRKRNDALAQIYIHADAAPKLGGADHMANTLNIVADIAIEATAALNPAPHP